MKLPLPAPLPPAPEAKQVPISVTQLDKSKCFACNKKVGLLGIECKCQLVFCNMHRMPEDHQCTINWRELGQKKLEKEHKKVVAKKIAEI